MLKRNRSDPKINVEEETTYSIPHYDFAFYRFSKTSTFLLLVEFNDISHKL